MRFTDMLTNLIVLLLTHCLLAQLSQRKTMCHIHYQLISL